MRFVLTLGAALIISAGTLLGGVVNTKHNLSKSNTTSSPHSTSEPEVCVFCHVPHNSSVARAPLWNQKSDNISLSGNMYNSDYLRRMGYPQPSDLGMNQGEPGVLSRACLSCHDGTVAPGSLTMLRGASNVTVSMDKAMSTAVVFNSGLSKHHPVGFEYIANTNQKSFGDGSQRGTELVSNPDKSIVKLAEYGKYPGKKYIECSSCHDPHTENLKFLRTQGANHAATSQALCTACHEKTDWSLSSHSTITSTYTDANVTAVYGGGTAPSVANMGCVNCHKPHNGEGKPYLLRKVEETTCFQGAGSSASVAPCHGANSALGGIDIQSHLSKAIKHPVVGTTGVHTNLDVFFGVGIGSDGGNGLTWSGGHAHAECTDCHNPHQARGPNHVAANPDAGGFYPVVPSNLVSNPLKGVTGVDVNWAVGNWAKQQSFLTMSAAAKEYQICFKCHSFWALGPEAGNYQGIFGTTGLARSPVTNHLLSNTTAYLLAERNVTDQAWEFSPYNRSAHPVVMTTNQMLATAGTARTVSPLGADTLKVPWKANVGNQTMMCSDCHGSDQENAAAPNNARGPHGSTFRFMLKGNGKYWPAGPGGSGAAVTVNGVTRNLYTMNDGQGENANIFCLNCHNYNTGVTSFTVHNASTNQMGTIACIECHVAVPHGSPLSRLIGYKTFPAPYNFQLNGVGQLKGEQYKPRPIGVTTNNNANFYAASCASGGGQGNGNGGGCHGSTVTGYELIP